MTHFVSSMGTTGTIMGTSRFLKEKNADIHIVGLQPADGASIAGAHKLDNWDAAPSAHLTIGGLDCILLACKGLLT